MVRCTLSVAVALVVASSAAGCGSSGTRAATGGGRADRALAAYADLPLTFVENRGQTDKRVRFHAQGAGHAVYLTREEIALTLQKDSGKGVALALRFLGADPRVVPAGDRARARHRQLPRGDDPARWHTRRARLPRGRVSRALAGDRPEAERAGRGAEVRVPRAARARGSRTSGWPIAARRACGATAPARCRSRPRWASCATRRRSPTRRSAACARPVEQPLRAERRRRLRVRGRALRARPRADHRPEPRLLDLPRRRRATSSAAASRSTRRATPT